MEGLAISILMLLFVRAFAHSEGSDVDVERFIQNLNEKISNGIYRDVDDDNDNDDGDDGNVGDDDNGHEDGEVDGDDDDDDDDDIIRNSFQRPPNSRLRFIRRPIMSWSRRRGCRWKRNPSYCTPLGR